MKVASSPAVQEQKPARSPEKTERAETPKGPEKTEEKGSLLEQAHQVGEHIGESLRDLFEQGGEGDVGERFQDFFSGLADSFADAFGGGREDGDHCCHCPRGQRGERGGPRRGGRSDEPGGTRSPGKSGQSGRSGQSGGAGKTGGIASASGSDDPAKQAAWINDYLSQQGSPAAAQNAGEYFVKYGQENNVDPMVLLSIAGHETQFGKLGVGVNGMLGVGAFDDDPDNSTRNSKYAGVENQIRLGAETFANLREKGGASADDPIDVQTAAVNKAGWATDQNWHNGVDRWYNQISQAAESDGLNIDPGTGGGSGTTDPAASQLGLAARNYGVDSPKINPGRGNTDWYYYCLGWTNQAFQDQGKVIPELQQEDAAHAYQAALANGKVQTGNPPPGAIVFFPDAANGLGHIGIMNEDGTYRGTVPASENPRTIGDRELKNADQVAWMYP
ncbi:MAG: glucosaminidase domain-containing protein [Candidatus Eremiobacteraeota bacterium]|nr:glucosaminidase domain-containing protein [Candidatus Eremiobacteraeota bacterium]MCW5870629.1 glucosaminidase domain-containing protein [Candidatus Eremiobacteraeota bacterium]